MSGHSSSTWLGRPRTEQEERENGENKRLGDEKNVLKAEKATVLHKRMYNKEKDNNHENSLDRSLGVLVV